MNACRRLLLAPAIFLAAAFCNLTPLRAQTNITVTGPPGVEFLGLEPPGALYERVLLQNRLDARLNIVNTNPSLTYQTGQVFFLNAQAQVLSVSGLSSNEFLFRRTTLNPDSFDDGRVTLLINNPPVLTEVASAARGLAGDYLLAGNAAQTNNGERFIYLANLLPSGLVNNAFGGAGRKTLNWLWLTNETVSAVAYSQGKILVAGTASVGIIPRFLLARLNADGSEDDTFAPAPEPADFPGAIATPLGTSAGARAMVVDSAQRIVLAGAALVPVFGTELALMRHNADGTLDPTFGNGGKVLADVPGSPFESLTCLALDAGERIVAGGWATVNGLPTMLVARFNAGNGGLDTTFGTNLLGYVLLPMPDDAQAQATSLVIASKGDIYIAGPTDAGWSAIVRLDQDGVALPIGTNDVFRIQAGTDVTTVNSLVFDSQGRLLCAGTDTTQGDTGFALAARLTAAGALDPTFGAGVSGIALQGMGGPFARVAQGILLPDDKLVLACDVADALGQIHFGLLRLTTNGAADINPNNTRFQLDLLDFPFLSLATTNVTGAFDRKLTPARMNVQLKFQEFAVPMVISGIELKPYHQAATPWRFPMLNPPTSELQFIQAHGFNSAHAGVASQRYAYDIVARDPARNNTALRSNVTVAQFLPLYTNHPNYNPNITYAVSNFAESRLIYNEPIYAAADGVVRRVAVTNWPNNFPVGTILPGSPGGGNDVIIEHPNGDFSFYAHMAPNTIVVKTGDSVQAGQLLGLVGNTGQSGSSHLHFHVMRNWDINSIAIGSGVPAYFTNARLKTQPANNPTNAPPVQLRCGFATGAWLDLAPAPAPPVPPPVSLGPGIVDETGDHETLATAIRLVPPVIVRGAVDAGTDPVFLAEAGDSIEDVYRVDLTAASQLTARLGFGAGADLDLQLYDERLHAIRPDTGALTANPEEIKAFLTPGTYYLFVSEWDASPLSSGPQYHLEVKLGTMGFKGAAMSGGNIVLRWSADADAAGLEETDAFSADPDNPTRWRPVAVRTERVGDDLQAEVPADRTGQRFFRLVGTNPE